MAGASFLRSTSSRTTQASPADAQSRYTFCAMQPASAAAKYVRSSALASDSSRSY